VVLGVAPWTGDEVVERAFAEAARRRAPLLAVRAAVTGSAEDARWELEMALSACRIVHPDVEVGSMVTAGRAADVLVSLSRDARLLVLGRSTRGALLAGLVGSPVRDLLRAAGCPVLVVPSDGPPHPSLLPGRRGRAFSGR
jgi:nucleotide-binding universal stress UspA family protein